MFLAYTDLEALKTGLDFGELFSYSSLTLSPRQDSFSLVGFSEGGAVRLFGPRAVFWTPSSTIAVVGGGVRVSALQINFTALRVGDGPKD